jgi:pimeloyl-ACP methyl ester carboxylesterase
MRISRRAALGLVAGGCAGIAMAPARAAVEEAGYVRIGGIDQWIAIRGSDLANPVIVFLHGGPGEAPSPFLDEFAPWLARFTVVAWDQRGAGKTFARNGLKTPDMNLARLVDDAVEVADYAKRKFLGRKILLVGQSWGSFLGVQVARKRPDLFAAFVGTGQVVDFAESADRRAEWGRAQAITENDQAALAAIAKAQALTGLDRIMEEQKATSKWRLSSSDKDYQKKLIEFLGPKPVGDAADWMAGAEFSADRLKDVVTTMSVRASGLDFGLPFYVIQGRDDHITDFGLARDLVNGIRAPAKGFFPIDGGHFACFTNGGAFADVLGGIKLG